MKFSMIDDVIHPERLAVLSYCIQGKGIEVGCGHRKSHPNCIGIDIIPKGEFTAKNRPNKVCVADILTSGDNLHMFGDGELDFVISRHMLEHCIDILKVLQEWKRVLKSGGIMAIVVPDEDTYDKGSTITLAHDMSHRHVFTKESLRRIIECIGGFDIIKVEVVIDKWSFICVSRRI